MEEYELDEVALDCNICLTRPKCMHECHEFLKKLAARQALYYFIHFEITDIMIKSKWIHITYFSVLYEKCPDSIPYVYKVKNGKHIVKQYIKILKLMSDCFNLSSTETSKQESIDKIKKFIKDNKSRDFRKFSLQNVCLNSHSFLNYEKDWWIC